jgi:radical SAM superfamily enzyme YgiQ (UPF0313 family)
MFLILDALAAGEGRRLSSLDVIGAGPRLLAGILERFNLEYKILRVEDFIRIGKKFKGVALVSAMTMDEPAVSRASKLIEGVKILGGPITSDLSSVKRLGFDLGVWGEGEISLESLLSRGLSNGIIPDVGGIPNIILPNGKTTEFRYLSREEFMKFESSTKAIKYYKTVPHYRSSRVYVEVQRSCSNFYRPRLIASPDICKSCPSSCSEICPQSIPPGCGYCSIPLLYGPPKSRSEESILREIGELAIAGVRRFVLSGADFLEYGRDLISTPLTNPRDPGPNLDAIDSLLSKVKGLSEKYSFFFEIENVKPCLVNEEVAYTLSKYLKGTPIHIGVETGDPEHARLIGRPCSPEDSFRAIKILKKYGLRPYAYFIHSLPGQSERVAKKTLEMMRAVYDAGAEKITIYRFKPLPGTAFQDFEVKVDRNSRMISELAIDLNRKRKEELLGKIMEVIVAPKTGRYCYAYPVNGGPVVRLRCSKGLNVGRIVRVMIKGVVSDRMVEGVVI